MKLIKRILILLGALPVLYVGATILVATIFKYKPSGIEQISKIEEQFYLNDTTIYSVLIWNIGYAGLGAEMDFFYDGGTKVRDTEDGVRRNLHKITTFLQENDTLDFILLQEVDENSKRSYGINMVDHFNLALPEHFPFYAYNYKVPFVPLPWLNPMGRVNSGLLSFSKHIPAETKRFAFKGNYAWPKHLFMLDRCYLANYFLLEDSTRFVLINTHNSAYDDGNLRKQQNTQLGGTLVNEETAGNAFLVGGDWNQCPPDFLPGMAQEIFHNWVFDTINFVPLDKAFMGNGWEVWWGNNAPTNRRLQTSYSKETSFTTVIDFFLSSSRVEVIECNTIDLNFANSDHQPVILTFKIKRFDE
jgi:endonuclease/exonuclease/phosphatase family metal-dependent hydrolase